MANNARHVGCRVTAIRLAASTLYLAKGERTLLIDTGPPGAFGLVKARLVRKSIGPGDIALILITHGHIDHCGNARALSEWLQAPVAMHRRDAVAARTGAGLSFHPATWLGRLTAPMAQRVKLPPAERFEPDIILGVELEGGRGEWRLDDYGLAGAVIHTPGHTAGSVSLILEGDAGLRGGESIAGDLLMPSLLGFGPPSIPLYADDLAQVVDSVRRLLRYEPRMIHTGHGGPFALESVRRRFGQAD